MNFSANHSLQNKIWQIKYGRIAYTYCYERSGGDKQKLNLYNNFNDVFPAIAFNNIAFRLCIHE